jgi:hypothetical protein
MMPPEAVPEAVGVARSNRLPLRTGLLVVCGLSWLATVTAGFALLNRYKTEPGAQDTPPSRWPRDTALNRSSDRATLLLFAHPGCPCTRSGLTELARLMSRVSSQVDAQVVVVEPRSAPDGWAGSELKTRAAAIPGVRVARDEDGTEAARFRAHVSGFVVLYDATGSRLFSGGITPSRGHEGDSPGRRRILAALAGERPEQDTSPVFGCALAVDHGAPHEAHHTGAHETATP